MVRNDDSRYFSEICIIKAQRETYAGPICLDGPPRQDDGDASQYPPTSITLVAIGTFHDGFGGFLCTSRSCCIFFALGGTESDHRSGRRPGRKILRKRLRRRRKDAERNHKCGEPSHSQS
eukprot:scaffold15121_cov145-Amphora_coffeaeformis.AAC.1